MGNQPLDYEFGTLLLQVGSHCSRIEKTGARHLGTAWAMTTTPWGVPGFWLTLRIEKATLAKKQAFGLTTDTQRMGMFFFLYPSPFLNGNPETRPALMKSAWDVIWDTC